MGSLSGLFDLTRQALAANQVALNATANNVANQNTAGYTREVASFSSGDTVTLSGNVQSSSGPEVTITSARDRVLEARVQQQMQAQSGTSARSDVLTQIQDVFSISGSATSSGETQLGTALDSFFSSLTALAGDPADSATQQGVLSAANVVASTFNSAANQLQAVNASINASVSNSVTAVNALTTTIAGLNQQISALSPHADAGSLEDQRQLAIEQLSQYVGLDQIQTENNGITLTTQGGAVLVEGATASRLSAVSSSGTTHILDGTGTDVTAGIEGGSIGGQLTAQSVDLPAVSSALDNLAYRVASAVNTQNQAGLTSAGAAGGAIFSVPADGDGRGRDDRSDPDRCQRHRLSCGGRGRVRQRQCQCAGGSCHGNGQFRRDDLQCAGGDAGTGGLAGLGAERAEYGAAGDADAADDAAR